MLASSTFTDVAASSCVLVGQHQYEIPPVFTSATACMYVCVYIFVFGKEKVKDGEKEKEGGCKSPAGLLLIL